MNGKCQIRCYAVLFFLLSGLSLPARTDENKDAAGSSVASLFVQAQEEISAGDTVAALELLNQVLKKDKNLWEARLVRGRLYLAGGKIKAARDEFNRALSAKSVGIRSRAHIGLGDLLRCLSRKNREAIAEYRLAIQVEPENLEAYHKAAQAALAMGTLDGYATASGLLLDLMGLDPIYGSAYETWRDTIRDKGHGELLKAGRSLETYADRYPEHACWLLDAAGYRYQAFEPGPALVTLEKLEAADPSCRPAERNLLAARCLLDLGDTLGFESRYRQAIDSAGKDGDFRRLILEAETIFTPDEEQAVRKLKTPEELAAFFRVFWRNKDPDPVSFHNERLIEHYRRLRTAEKLYKVSTLYNLKQTSDNYLRLMSIPEQTTVGFKPGMPNRDGALYDYDPVRVFGGRSPELGLDHRGLVYVRHGPPNYVDKEVIHERRDGFVDRKDMNAVNTEVWVYWPNKIWFKKGFGSLDYMFFQSLSEAAADIEHAMHSQTFEDHLPIKEQDFYSAVFLRQDGRLDLEFYQSIPAEESKEMEPPAALLAVYDRSLEELARDSVQTIKVPSLDDSIWVAVNDVPMEPGNYSFALSLPLPDVRNVVMGNLAVNSLTGKTLELSGIILGSQPEPARPVHRRMDVPLLPRPSRKFSLNEIITVYFEIYGLGPGKDGRRACRELITVSIEKEKRSALNAVFFQDNRRSGSLTLSFEHQPETNSGTVPGYFTIDTSFLVPGSYRLLIQVVDDAGGNRQQAESIFELE